MQRCLQENGLLAVEVGGCENVLAWY